MIHLRPYQHHAIENLRRSIASGHKRVLLQAATGAGKTIIACEMIRLAITKSYKSGWAYIKWNERKTWLESNGYPVPVT